MLKKSKIKELIFDLIFPMYCFGCGLEGNWVCSSCKTKIVLRKTQICPSCSRVSLNGKICPKCRKNFTLDGVLTCAYFEEGPTRELIHNFKYNNILDLKQIFNELMVQALAENPVQFDLITFTPMHWRRLAEKGYNHSEIMARSLADKLETQCLPLLIKQKITKRQAELDGKARRENLKSAFKVESNKVENIEGKKILIIDDVFTTGSTLNECASVLKKAGAKKVWGLVLAKD